MSYYGAGGNAFGGFPGGYSVGPGGVPITNLGVPGAPATLGANLPSVDPNNFGGTVHFGPSTTYGGQYPSGANMPNWNAGAGAGGNFYPGASGGGNFYPGASGGGNFYPGY